jgi:hypothetical protein
MAKKQELALNPGKLSGICGRLMCCLGYEIDHPSKDGGKVKEKTKSPVITDKHEVVPGPVSPKADTIPPPKKTERDTEKVSPQKPLPRKEEQKPAGEQTKPSSQKRKDRGKPFSKRRRFRKKKR